MVIVNYALCLHKWLKCKQHFHIKSYKNHQINSQWFQSEKKKKNIKDNHIFHLWFILFFVCIMKIVLKNEID